MDLKANTAVDVLIGPFVDSTDGNTAETALTISQADVRLSKNGQNMAQKNDATACAHDELGFYNCELDATDLNTEGNLVLVVHETGALPVRHEFNVLSEAAWDSLYAAKDTGFMDVNIKAVSEDETAADNLELACDNYSATRGLSGTALPAAAADGAGGLPISDAGGLALDAQLANTNEITAARMAALTDWINGGRLDLIIDAILADTGELQTNQGNWLTVTGHATEAKQDIIDGIVDAILVDTGTTLPATLAAIAGYLDTEIAAILADTNELQAAWANGGRLDLILDIIAADTTTDIPALIAALDVIIDRIEVDTQDLQTQIGTAGAGLTGLPDVNLANGAHGGAAASLTLSSYTDFTGAGASNPNLLLEAEIAVVNSQTEFTLVTGSDQDDAYNDQAIVLYDDNNSDYPSIRVITNYVGATKTVTIDAAPDFTLGADDSIRIFVTAPGSSAPTVGQIRTEIDNNSTQLAAIVADTNDLQTNQGNWLTAVGFNTVVPPSVAQFNARSLLAAEYTIVSDLGTVQSADNNTLLTAIAGYLDTEIAAILLDTGTTIPALIAALDAVVDTVKAETALIVADTNELQTNQGNWATVTGHATEVKQDVIDGIVDAIKIVTDNLPDAGALNDLAAILVDTGTSIPALIAALNDPAASAIADAVLDEVMADLADNSLNVGESITPRKVLRGLFNRFFREVTQTATAQIVKNDSAAQIASMAVSDDGTTQTKGVAT